jgi:hypothetical protein
LILSTLGSEGDEQLITDLAFPTSCHFHSACCTDKETTTRIRAVRDHCAYFLATLVHANFRSSCILRRPLPFALHLDRGTCTRNRDTSLLLLLLAAERTLAPSGPRFKSSCLVVLGLSACCRDTRADWSTVFVAALKDRKQEDR